MARSGWWMIGGAACAGEVRPQVASLVTAPAAADWPWPGDLSGLEEVVVLDGASGPGAVLFWSDLASSEAGLPGVDAARGADVSTVELPVRMDDPTEAPPSWLSVVRVRWPGLATRGLVVSAFRDRVPEYEAIDGLSRKDFLITRDRTLGGIYRWTDAQAAGDRFDDTWYAEAEDRYGERPTVDGFEILEIR